MSVRRSLPLLVLLLLSLVTAAQDRTSSRVLQKDLVIAGGSFEGNPAGR